MFDCRVLAELAIGIWAMLAAAIRPAMRARRRGSILPSSRQAKSHSAENPPSWLTAYFCRSTLSFEQLPSHHAQDRRDIRRGRAVRKLHPAPISSERKLTSQSSRLRRRGPAHSTPDIPLVHPSELPTTSIKPLIPPSPSISREASPTPSEIDEILRQGGVIPLKPEDEERERDVWDEIFDTALLAIPFSFLYLLLDM